MRRTLTASGGTLVGSAAGALLPFLIARWFEVGRATDVYFLVVGAVQLVGYMLALVVESAALPFAAKAVRQDRECLRVFARSLARYVAAAALPITLAASAAIALVLLPAAGLAGTHRADALELLLAVGALPFLAALSGVASAANFALDRFAFTTGTQVLRAGGGILFAVALGDHLGLLAVALGLTAGEALRALTLTVALPRTPKQARFNVPDVGLQMLRLASPTLIASIVIAVNPIVDKAVAARLDPGATTLIELGEKLFYVPMVLLVAAVSKVSATVWARQVDVNDVALHRDFWRTQRLGLAATSLVVLLGLVALATVGDWARDFLGLPPGSEFSAVVVVYLVGLPVALAADLTGAMIIILRRTSVLPALAVGLVLVNAAADVIGAALFGVVGIAASSTLVRLINVAVLILVAERHLRRPTVAPPLR